jgi:hypothetical protein
VLLILLIDFVSPNSPGDVEGIFGFGILAVISGGILSGAIGAGAIRLFKRK